MSIKPIKTLSSQIAWACRWYQVRKDEIELPDGTIGEYNIVEVPACSFVVPVLASGEIVLIRQYRYPFDEWVWEIPAGTCKTGQSPDEASREELLEEIGGVAESWQKLGAFHTANGRTNEVAHLYLATGVTMGKTAHESAEIMTIHQMGIAELYQLIEAGKMADGPSVLALLLAKKYLI